MPYKSRLAGFIIDCNVDDLDAAAERLEKLGARKKGPKPNEWA